MYSVARDELAAGSHHRPRAPLMVLLPPSISSSRFDGPTTTCRSHIVVTSYSKGEIISRCRFVFLPVELASKRPCRYSKECYPRHTLRVRLAGDFQAETYHNLRSSSHAELRYILLTVIVAHQATAVSSSAVMTLGDATNFDFADAHRSAFIA